MSERNAKMKHQQDEIEFMKKMMQVKDRLLLEFMIIFTTNKMVMPPHIIKIIEQLYPGRIDALNKTAEEIEKHEQAASQTIKAYKESGEENVEEEKADA